MPYEYLPTPANVKALIPMRNEGRPFSAQSIPTEAQVGETIANVASEVQSAIGLDVALDASLHDLARYTTALGAAAEVERSFWPEQHEATDSTYIRLKRRYDELKAVLVETVTGGSGASASPKVLRTTRFKTDYLHVTIPPEVLA